MENEESIWAQLNTVVLAEYAEAARSLHNLEQALVAAQARYRKALEALNAEVLK